MRCIKLKLINSRKTSCLIAISYSSKPEKLQVGWKCVLKSRLNPMMKYTKPKMTRTKCAVLEKQKVTLIFAFYNWLLEHC